jgi:hypothetical protein
VMQAAASRDECDLEEPMVVRTVLPIEPVPLGPHRGVIADKHSRPADVVG